MRRYDLWIIGLVFVIVGLIFDYPTWLLICIAILTGLLFGWAQVYDPRNQDVEDPAQEKLIRERSAMWLARAAEEEKAKEARK